jgi:hypothetical protein
MQAATKEEVKIKTRFDRDNQTFYFQVVGPREESAGEEGPQPRISRGRRASES